MYKRKTAARAEFFFFSLIRSIVVVFNLLVAFSLSLVLLDFILAKSIYYSKGGVNQHCNSW